MQNNGFRIAMPVKSVFKVAKIIATGIVVISAVAGACGIGVMLLWNWLMPEIFGLPTIGYLQAVGLIMLAHVLVKSSSAATS
jgi:hypothetical protein